MPAFFIPASDSIREDGVFQAKQVLAKHDERYMPREVQKQLKKQGEWRGDGQTPSYERQAYAPPAADVGGGAAR